MMIRKLAVFCALLCFMVLSPVNVPANERTPLPEFYFGGEQDDKIAETDDAPIQPPSLPDTLPPTFAPAAGEIIPARDLSLSYIPTVQHPQTSVIFVGTPMDLGHQVYTIVASTPITGVTRTLLPDNRLALDIVNSTTTLSGALTVPPFLAVSGIRVSQFTADTTRVVFDLEGGTDFNVDISADRTTVFVTVHQHHLQNISFAAEAQHDLLILHGVRPSALQVQPGQGTLRFFLTNTQLMVVADTPLEGGFVSHLELSQWNPHVGLLELTVSEFTSHSIYQLGPNETAIRLHPATYRNISYSPDERAVRIPHNNEFEIPLEHISRFDLYHNRQFILWLPLDISEHLGFGEMLVASTLLRSVAISTTEGQGTQLIFNGNQIFTLDIERDDYDYIIRIMHPRERYPRIVILDPGHGGTDPGAVRGNFRESDLVLDITRKVLHLINNDGIVRAYTTRNSDTRFSDVQADDLRARADFGNAVGDIFVSIHLNAAHRTAVHGIETYYRASPHDEFRLLTSRNLAEIMHRNKLNVLRSHDREVRSANFAVLRHSTIPAVLLELGFMSNPQELARMVTPEFQWQAAQAIYQGILEAFLYIPGR